MREYQTRENQWLAGISRSEVGRPAYADLLQGYRFTVCETAEAFENAMDVRRRVYNGTCGYQLPIPDGYDHRSWLLLAEHVPSEEAVGTMRVTSRAGGRLEAEEYLTLPPRLRSPRTVEVNRFAVVPAHVKLDRFPAAVSLGLFKLMVKFSIERLGALHAILCAREERVWAFEWLRFQRSGLVARYAKLGNVDHEVLTLDLATRPANDEDQALSQFLFETEHPEIKLPPLAPTLSQIVENVSQSLVHAMSA